MRLVVALPVALLALVACEDSPPATLAGPEGVSGTSGLSIGPTLNATEFPLGPMTSWVAVGGDYVAWWSGDGTWLHDYVNGSPYLVDPCNSFSVLPPAVSQTHLFYQDGCAPNRPVHAVSLVSWQDVVASGPNVNRPWRPGGGKNLVAYLDERDGRFAWEVYLYDIVSQTETLVSPGSVHQGFSRPHVSNGYVAWEGLSYQNGTYDRGFYLYSPNGGTPARFYTEDGNRCIGFGIDFDWPLVARSICPETADFRQVIRITDVRTGVATDIDEGRIQSPQLAGDFVLYSKWDANRQVYELVYYNLVTGTRGSVVRDPQAHHYVSDSDDRRVLHWASGIRHGAQVAEASVLEPTGEPRAATVLDEVDPPQGVPDFVTLPNGTYTPPLPPGAVVDEYGVLMRIERGS